MNPEEHLEWNTANDLPTKLADIWQLGVRKFACGEDEQWCVLIVSRCVDSSLPDRVIIWYELCDERPNFSLLADRLMRAMVFPRRGRPCKPSGIEFLDAEMQWFRPFLSEIGVRTTSAGRAEVWEQVFERLERTWRHVYSVPAIEADSSRDFMISKLLHSARQFAQQIPHLPVESVFEIGREIASGHQQWFAILSNRLFGSQAGLLLVERNELVEPLNTTVEDLLRHCVCLSVSFTAAGTFPNVVALRHNPGGSVRTLIDWEIEFVELCMHLLPSLVILPNCRIHRDGLHLASSHQVILKK